MGTEDTRRGRGGLEADVKSITDAYVEGGFVLPEDQALTPHRIAQAVKNADNLDKPPSTGAVQAILKRWEGIGFAVVSTGPIAFKEYTTEAGTVGLKALKERAAKPRKPRKAAEPTEAEVVEAEVVEPEAEPVVAESTPTEGSEAGLPVTDAPDEGEYAPPLSDPEPVSASTSLSDDGTWD